MQNDNSTTTSQKDKPFLLRKVKHRRAILYIVLAVAVLLFYVSLLQISSVYHTSLLELMTLEEAALVSSPKSYLFLTPARDTVRVGEEFPVNIFVDTRSKNVVVVSANLSYDKDHLEVISVDLSGSLFELTAENEVNEAEGKIKITVGKPTPGVKTRKGKVATVYFRAKAAMTPYTPNIYFNFTPGSSFFSTVILDDKQGTNILVGVKGAKITIK
ncbi:MAG: cohesin domain-containing protein [Nitrososphaerota archaeon]